MPSSEMDMPCVFLTWDSMFFGHRIARVVGHRLSLSRVISIQDWCTKHEIECLYFLADSNHDETVILAEERGFHLVDVRITLLLRGPVGTSVHTLEASSIPDTQIRTARSSDIPKLEAIARTAHKDTRFYYDHHFSTSQCSDLYATWVRRSHESLADQVLVAEQGGQVVGYITCTRDFDNGALGHIGLMGVAARARGRGIGSTLVKRSLHWFAEQGVQEVKVVTQGRNVPAQRMYQRCGFVTYSVQMWYHTWSVIR